ncbi:MAG: sensor histidine kinase [Akkermansiaceae bacterium]
MRSASETTLQDTSVLRTGESHISLEEAMLHNGWKTASYQQDLFPGHDPSTFWLRTILRSNSSENNQFVISLESTRWEELDWFIIRDNGTIEQHTAGNAHLGKPGMLPGTFPNIRLTLHAGEQVQLYLRAQTNARGNLMLSVENINEYFANDSNTHLVVIFSILVTLCILSLIFAAYSNQKGAIAYSISTIAATITYAGLSGLAKSFQWPFSHFLTMEGTHFFSAIAFLAGLSFNLSFFNINSSSGWHHQALRILIILNIILLPLTLLLPFPLALRFINIFFILYSTLCFLIAIRAWKKKVRFAKFYLFSWIPLWLTLTLDSLFREIFISDIPSLGLIAPLGIVLSKLLLFFALIDKVRSLALEHERNQEQLLKLERHQNEELEKKVQKRTKSLDKSRKEAVKANRYKDLFLANMSHEIRTPLSALIGLSQILVHEGEKEGLPEHFKRMLGQIKSGGSHLELMLTNLLDIGAARHGKIPIQLSTFNLKNWIQTMTDILEPLANAKEIKIHWDNRFAPSDNIHQDIVRLSQILTNLVHNAIKFSPQKDPIHVIIQLQDDTLTIQVDNKGVQLPENPNILFEMFEKNNTVLSDHQHGAGLGLYIVKTSAQLLGGKASVTKLPDKGASFQAIIPNSNKS